jgi:hypothetical protein
MPRLSLGLGAQTIRKVGGGAAPSGIPVATTNTINVVDTFGYNATATLTKVDSTLYENNAVFGYGELYCGLFEQNVPFTVNNIRLRKQDNGNGTYTWIYEYNGYIACDGDEFSLVGLSNVAEITNGIIPTTGWSPSITITAA